MIKAYLEVLDEGINFNPKTRKELEALYGKIWDMDELTTDFTVIKHSSPIVLVTHNKTNKSGTLFYQNVPRYYWGYKEE